MGGNPSVEEKSKEGKESGKLEDFNDSKLAN